MKQNYKTKEIHLRLTENEYLRLKEKSANYPTLSSFVLDACMNFDDALGIKRLNIIRNWCEDYNKFESMLNKIGSNINQLAHHVNKLSSVGIVSPGFIPALQNQYGILIELFKEITNSNIQVKNIVSDFMHLK